MINLAHLRGNLLKDFIEFLNAKTHCENSIETYERDIPTFDLLSLIKIIDTPKIAYWRDKLKENESLFLGEQYLFKTKKEIQEMFSLSQNQKELRFIGGLNFDFTGKESKDWPTLQEGVFRLPYVELRRKKDQCKLYIHYPSEIIDSNDLRNNFLIELDKSLETNEENEKKNHNEIREIQVNPDKGQWQKTFRKALQKFSDEEFYKVVLARKKVFHLEGLIDRTKTIDSLDGMNPHSYLIFFQFNKNHFFISNSPETLFKRENNYLYTEAIAGTRIVGETPEENRDFQNELRSSLKEVSEHRLVKVNLEEKCAPFSTDMKWKSEEQILVLKHIQHLHSILEVKLKNDVNTIDILTSFHPTPAVGGAPWKKAKDFLRKNETFDRGLYAAPMGVVSKEYTEFSVAIRSALAKNDTLHVYAGAGIVKGSQEQSEWNEIENKMKNFEDAILE